MVPEYIDIPIFPLPNVTFFTHTFLPLHIFEDRYRQMIANSIEGDRLIGVALLKEGWQRNYFGQPPICKTFGVGKIIDWQELADGRYNIVLEGLYRVRLIEEFPTDTYRTGRARVLLDPPIDSRRGLITGLMKEIQALTDELGRLMPKTRELVQSAWSSHPHPLIIGNHLAAGLVIDPYNRQSILEQDDPLRRLQLTRIQLGSIIHQLKTDPQHSELFEED